MRLHLSESSWLLSYLSITPMTLIMSTFIYSPSNNPENTKTQHIAFEANTIFGTHYLAGRFRTFRIYAAKSKRACKQLMLTSPFIIISYLVHKSTILSAYLYARSLLSAQTETWLNPSSSEWEIVITCIPSSESFCSTSDS